MIFKNDASGIKMLPVIRIFMIVFEIFLVFFIGKPVLELGLPLIGTLAGLFVPIMFLIIIPFEACITKYIDSIEIDNSSVSIKHGNGYVNKTVLLNKEDILSFSVDIIAVNRWYYTKGCNRYITFDTIINICLKNGTEIILKDSSSGLEITKLLCSVYKKIPNFKFVSSIHNEQDFDIVKQLEQFKHYYDKLLNSTDNTL